MNDTTLHESNNEIILKKVEGIGDGTYELKVESPLLRLVPKRGYLCNERGNIEFDTQNKDNKIDFASIASYVRRSIETRLLNIMRRPGLEWNEWSQPFYVIYVKPKRLSIEERRQKKIKKNNGDSITELYITPERESCDDISFAVEELSQSVIRDKNHCWIINFSDFNKQISGRKIIKSIKNVLNIIKVYRDRSDFDLKVLYNATKEALFDYLREYIHKLEPSMKQLIIFVMSHGKCDGFFTSDNEFVTHTEFIGALNNITKCLAIKTFIILAHCREEPTSTNIHNFPDENISIAYSASPGQLEYLNTSGSMFVDKILRKLLIRLPTEGTIDLVVIVEEVIELFKEHPIIHKGVRVYQQPYITGVISGGFQFTYSPDKNKKKKESGGDILDLPNLDSIVTDLE